MLTAVPGWSPRAVGCQPGAEIQSDRAMHVGSWLLVSSREGTGGRGPFYVHFKGLLAFLSNHLKTVLLDLEVSMSKDQRVLLFSQLIIIPHFTRNWGPSAPKLCSRLVVHRGGFL